MSIRVYDRRDLPVASEKRSDESVAALAWSHTHQGDTPLAVATGKHVFLWHVPLLALGKQLRMKASAASLAWSPDGKYVATPGHGNSIHVWNVADGTMASYDESPQHVAPKDLQRFSKIRSLAFAPGRPADNYLAAGSNDGTVHVWNISSGKHLQVTAQGRSVGTIGGVAWSPFRTVLLAATSAGSVLSWIWHPSLPVPLQTYAGHRSCVQSLSIAPDGTSFASASDDGTVRVWDVFSGKCQFVYHGHTEAVFCVAWSPDGTRIASAGYDHTVQVWEPGASGQWSLLCGHSFAVNGLAWSPDGLYLASGGTDGHLLIWSVPVFLNRSRWLRC